MACITLVGCSNAGTVSKAFPSFNDGISASSTDEVATLNDTQKQTLKSIGTSVITDLGMVTTDNVLFFGLDGYTHSLNNGTTVTQSIATDVFGQSITFANKRSTTMQYYGSETNVPLTSYYTLRGPNSREVYMTYSSKNHAVKAYSNVDATVTVNGNLEHGSGSISQYVTASTPTWNASFVVNASFEATYDYTTNEHKVLNSSISDYTFKLHADLDGNGSLEQYVGKYDKVSQSVVISASNGTELTRVTSLRYVF